MGALQTTKRDVLALASRRTTWIGLGAAGIILGIAGPFGTADALSLVPRIAYWLVTAAIGFFLGSTVSTFIAESLRARRVNLWLAVVIAGAIAGIVNLGALLVLNWLVFRLSPTNPGYLASLSLNVVVISVIIAAAYVAISHEYDRREAKAAPPRILSRLPLEKRGTLISLSVADHYVEVATTQGTELVLIRLADAMCETGDLPGLQVHRSHWVATGQVVSVRRDGARAILTMSDGRDIPVSRTYLPAIKEAGLIPG